METRSRQSSSEAGRLNLSREEDRNFLSDDLPQAVVIAKEGPKRLAFVATYDTNGACQGVVRSKSQSWPLNMTTQ